MSWQYNWIFLKTMKADIHLNCIKKNFIFFHTENTFHLHCKDKLVSAVWGNSCSLYWVPYKHTCKYTAWAKCGVINVAARGTVGLAIVNLKKLAYYTFFLHCVAREQCIQCKLCSGSWLALWVVCVSCHGQ